MTNSFSVDPVSSFLGTPLFVSILDGAFPNHKKIIFCKIPLCKWIVGTELYKYILYYVTFSLQ